MTAELKPLAEQIIVITGASSGIGLATAEVAVAKGAKVVLAARSGEALAQIAARFEARGGEALAIACDVADRAAVARVADAAIQRFGRIDTWVNNAGVGMYGRLDEVDERDARRLFDINFWGVVNGSLVALPHLARGGALINVGSEVSEATAPLLGIYNASKHAVKGFTDTLRIEIEDVDDAPISITLIEPTAVDTPFPQHARNYMTREPKLPGRPIDAIRVAQAILDAACSPTRLQRVGAKATLNAMTAKLAPRLADKMSAKLVDQQQYDEPPRNPQGVLDRPSGDTHSAGRIRGTGGRQPTGA
jgi:short-subunit dehydrogenase